jgi:capsular exopolysaccharide synthesis family protein
VLTQRQLGVLTDLAEMKKQHAQTRYELMNAQRRLQAHVALGKAAKDAAVPEATLAEALAADLQAKTHQLRIERLKTMIRDYEPSVAKDDPSLVRLRGQLDNEEKALEERRSAARTELARRSREKAQAEYDAVLAQLQSDAESLAAQEKALAGEAEALAERAKKIGTSSTELEMLRKKVEREEKYADKLWGDLSALKGELNSPPRVTLHQEAALQQKDMKRQLMATAGAPLLMLAAVGLAVAWLEFRLRRIRTAEEVASGLGIRVVGAVPELGRSTAAAGEHGVVESIDAIRTMLLHDASVEAARVVMVTSAAAGEGKTTLACSLADSLARAGRKTLLIDCDLRTPAAHQLFELPLQPGFSEVLLSEIDAPDAVQATPVPGLSVMTAGQWDREVLKALAHEGTAGIFEKLKDEFDFVVVDSHPVLAATDSLLLGQHVDAVLLSILRDVSRSPRVYSACQRLATLGIRMLGAVVNGAAPDDVYANGAPQAAPAAR